MAISLHETALFALPFTLTFVVTLFKFTFTTSKCDRYLDATIGEMQIQGDKGVASAFHFPDEFGDFTAMHQEFARTI